VTATVVQHHSIADEINTLADYIDWYLQQHPGEAAGEVLVLANRRMIGNGIRDRLNEIGLRILCYPLRMSVSKAVD
jgi:hypothetical protein